MFGGIGLGHSWTEGASWILLLLFLVTLHPLLRFMVGICKATRAAARRERGTPWQQLSWNVGSTSVQGAAGTACHQPDVLWHWLGSLAFQGPCLRTAMLDSSSLQESTFVYFQKSVQLNEHLQNTFWLWIHYNSVPSDMYSLCLAKRTDSVVLPKLVYQNSGVLGCLSRWTESCKFLLKPSKNTDSCCRYTEMPKPGECCQPGSYSAVSVPGGKTL